MMCENHKTVHRLMILTLDGSTRAVYPAPGANRMQHSCEGKAKQTFPSSTLEKFDLQSSAVHSCVCCCLYLVAHAHSLILEGAKSVFL